MKKNTSDNGEPQIITQINTAALEVNSRPQEAKVWSLEPPSCQEMNTWGGAYLTRIEKGNFPSKQVKKNEKTPAIPKLIPKVQDKNI